MDFQLVSKNNVGAVATLFLVILLSQSRFFDFLIDTALGRTILILFILGISYTNKILGVVAVLFIIIAFNNSDIGYLEGFTNTKATKDKVDEDTSVSKTDGTSVSKTNGTSVSKTNGTSVSKTDGTSVSKTDSTSVSKTDSKGIEGFNITEKEHMMLRGKRSSEIPVYSNARNQDDDVEPSDKAVFSGNYSSV
jgi:hypothetical protein